MFVCSSMYLFIYVSKSQRETCFPWWDLPCIDSKNVTAAYGCMDRKYDSQKRILNSEEWSCVRDLQVQVQGTMCKRASGNQSARIDANCTLYIITQCQASLKEEQPTNLIENIESWCMGYGSCSFMNRRMNQSGSKNRRGKCRCCVTIFALVVSYLHFCVFFFSMSEPLAPPMLLPAFVLGYTYGIHQWSVDPSTRFFQCHFHLATSTAPRQNLPPVPFLPPPAAPGMHRPSAPPPAGRGQILDATWGAPATRPATPAPLWAPLRVCELRDGGNNKGWAEEVCWWLQTVKSSETWV